LGIVDLVLGIGDWAQSPIPNPQSPIPNPQKYFELIKYINELNYINLYYNIKILNKQIIIK
jgi:hypothetical protein